MNGKMELELGEIKVSLEFSSNEMLLLSIILNELQASEEEDEK